MEILNVTGPNLTKIIIVGYKYYLTIAIQQLKIHRISSLRTGYWPKINLCAFLTALGASIKEHISTSKRGWVNARQNNFEYLTGINF